MLKKKNRKVLTEQHESVNFRFFGTVNGSVPNILNQSNCSCLYQNMYAET